MAHVYVDSNAVGGGTGADWANAYTTLGAALAAKAAGDNFWVAENHAETQATDNILVNPGSLATPCTVICVNSAGSVPPVEADLATTATITTTGNSDIRFQGSFYLYGITFNCGTGANNSRFTFCNALGSHQVFEACKFDRISTTTANDSILINGGDRTCTWINCVVKFASSGDNISVDTVGRGFRWLYTDNAIDVATATPTELFRTFNETGTAELVGVDLTNLGANDIWLSTNAENFKLTLRDCKVSSSMAITTPTRGAANQLNLIRCDSGGTNYRTERYDGLGTLTTETSVVRTGGATDGTTPIAWKVVTGADADWQFPFESFPINVWNDSVRQITVTVYGTWGGGAVPNNDDCWIEVNYLGSVADPLGSLAQNGLTTWLSPAVAQDADAVSVWAADTSPARVNFKMRVTFTPAQKGALALVIKCAKASDTFYFDPKPEIT